MKPLKTLHLVLLLVAIAVQSSVLSQEKVKVKDDKLKVKTDEGKMKMDGAKMQSSSPIDTLAIERIMGMKGKSNNGEYKITIPQNDLSVMVDGFKIIPAMGLSTWVAFTPAGNGVMFMGDIVITETDLKAVQAEIIS